MKWSLLGFKFCFSLLLNVKWLEKIHHENRQLLLLILMAIRSWCVVFAIW